jgi:hypothetical protein
LASKRGLNGFRYTRKNEGSNRKASGGCSNRSDNPDATYVEVENCDFGRHFGLYLSGIGNKYFDASRL